jgi:hypothetical protein
LQGENNGDLTVLENHLLEIETCQASDPPKAAGESAKDHMLYDFSDEQVESKFFFYIRLKL